jgi:hypothetical protein
MRTAIGVRKRAESALIRPQFGRTTTGHLRLSELALLLSISGAAPPAVYKPSQVLAANLASLTGGRRKRKTRYIRHSREGGNPVSFSSQAKTTLGPRLRGDDEQAVNGHCPTYSTSRAGA